MSKQEQLMEYITQDIVTFIMEDEKLDMSAAMHKFYASNTYDKLMDAETGLYLESSAYVYELFKDESLHGEIVQNEI